MNKKYTEEYVQINGILQYFLHIQNPSDAVVIMLHGGPGLANSYIAYYLQPYLDFCNVVYYDQRGAGKTQIKNKTAPEDLAMDNLLEDLKQTIEYIKQKYKTDKIFLAGHSWGSMLGTQYILKYPQTVTGYIGYGQVIDGAIQDRSWYAYLKAEVLKSGNEEAIKALNSVNAHFPNVASDKYFDEYYALFELSLNFKYEFMANDVFEIYSKSPIWTAEDEAHVSDTEKLNGKLYNEVLLGYDISHVKTYRNFQLQTKKNQPKRRCKCYNAHGLKVPINRRLNLL